MFRADARKITPEEFPIVQRFVDALVPGMLYVRCGECQKFRQVVRDNTKTMPHPTEPNSRLLIHVCEECK